MLTQSANKIQMKNQKLKTVEWLTLNKIKTASLPKKLGESNGARVNFNQLRLNLLQLQLQLRDEMDGKRLKDSQLYRGRARIDRVAPCETRGRRKFDNGQSPCRSFTRILSASQRLI